MISYYNEIDPFASKWLVNLSYHGHIASRFGVAESVVSRIKTGARWGHLAQ